MPPSKLLREFNGSWILLAWFVIGGACLLVDYLVVYGVKPDLRFPYDPLFSWMNIGEAALWIIVAVLIAARFARGGRNSLAWPLAWTVVLFGFSDIVEVYTGAWWRPWWLLAWKAGCLLVIAILLAKLIRRRRSLATADVPLSSDPTGTP